MPKTPLFSVLPGLQYKYSLSNEYMMLMAASFVSPAPGNVHMSLGGGGQWTHQPPHHHRHPHFHAMGHERAAFEMPSYKKRRYKQRERKTVPFLQKLISLFQVSSFFKSQQTVVISAALAGSSGTHQVRQGYHRDTQSQETRARPSRLLPARKVHVVSATAQ